MSLPPQAAMLPDGRRLHLHHGPIDLVIGAEGPGRDAALARAEDRFGTVLDGLVAELPGLHEAYAGQSFADPVAGRMAAAVAPFAETRFVTPMAAVAGAVADEVLAAMTAGDRLDKAWVNNGGDIAFHLGAGQHFEALGPAGPISIGAADGARGIATSGWRGRSLSLGIADAVTVLAGTAARADAAATLIANAVDLPGHPAIRRRPAAEVETHAELHDRPVTVEVGHLSAAEVAAALDAGSAFAGECKAGGLIEGAVLSLNGTQRVI